MQYYSIILSILFFSSCTNIKDSDSSSTSNSSTDNILLVLSNLKYDLSKKEYDKVLASLNLNEYKLDNLTFPKNKNKKKNINIFKNIKMENVELAINNLKEKRKKELILLKEDINNIKSRQIIKKNEVNIIYSKFFLAGKISSIPIIKTTIENNSECNIKKIFFVASLYKDKQIASSLIKYESKLNDNKRKMKLVLFPGRSGEWNNSKLKNVKLDLSIKNIICF